ncbi:MAG TPA: V-type ATP synthase subunit F [Candidatus Nanoarchaeia archaeon]|nr:V-type ATP synthase subunit F [Candidatus Nanoarchaeia archaeon]
MNIAVLGAPAFTLGFRLAGIRSVSENVKEMETLLHSEDLGIIITDKSSFEKLSENTKEDALKSIKPVVVVISDEPQEELRKMIIRSIGVDLLKE